MTEERTNTNVLMVEPGKAPYETQIGDDLQSMQAVVGGYIQAVYPYEEPVALICNEDFLKLTWQIKASSWYV